jgi:NDP-sugar pyrophosphorylase family protein
VQATDFFQLPASLQLFAASFPADVAPWEWLKAIGPALKAYPFPATPPAVPAGVSIVGPVYLHPTVKLPASATIIGPAWIGEGTEIRPGAYIRGNVIIGARCVIGNSCEFKNSLLLDGVQVPHFSYVGDSILGNGAHLGAGVILSNLRLDQKSISVRLPDATVDTGLRKFGAILGDQAEVGCNAVLQPGTIMGKRALVMPTVAYGGYLPAATIARIRATVITQPRRD